MAEWTQGLPDQECTCQVRPTEDIALAFAGGERATWSAGDIRIVTVMPLIERREGVESRGWAGLFAWPGVKNGRVLVKPTRVEWCPILIPDGMEESHV